MSYTQEQMQEMMKQQADVNWGLAAIQYRTNSASPAPELPDLERVRERVLAVANALMQNNDRLSQAYERIHGPTPQDGPAAHSVPSPAGLLYQINEALDRIEAAALRGGIMAGAFERFA